jgi:hypothetical protein
VLIGVAIVLKTCVWEVISSNLSHDTIYPDWGLLWLSSLPPRKCCHITWKLAMTASFYVWPFQYVSHPAIWCCIISLWVTLDCHSDLQSDLSMHGLKPPLPKLEPWECDECKWHSSISERIVWPEQKTSETPNINTVPPHTCWYVNTSK